MSSLNASVRARLLTLLTAAVMAAPIGAASAANPFPSVPAPDTWTTLVSQEGFEAVAVSPYFYDPSLPNSGDGLVFLGGRGDHSVDGAFLYNVHSNTLTGPAGLDESGVTAFNVVATGTANSPNFVVFALTYAGAVFSSTDGLHWTPINLGTFAANTHARALSVAASPQYATDHTIFVGTDVAGVLESKDAGGTFAPQNTGLLPSAGGNPWPQITALAVSPHFDSPTFTDHTVLAGTADRGIFESINGTLTQWAQVLGPPSLQKNLTFVPQQIQPMPKVLSIAMSPNWQLLGMAGSDNMVAAALDESASGTAVPGGIWTCCSGTPLSQPDGLAAPDGVTLGSWSNAGIDPNSDQPNLALNRPSEALAFSPMFAGQYTGDETLYSLQPQWSHPLAGSNPPSSVTDTPAIVREGERGKNGDGNPALQWCALPAASGGCPGDTAAYSNVYGLPLALAVAAVGDTTFDSFNTHLQPTDPSYQVGANQGYVNYVFMADALKGLEVFADDSPTMLNNEYPNYAADGVQPAVDIWGYNLPEVNSTPSVYIKRYNQMTGAFLGTFGPYPQGPTVYFQAQQAGAPPGCNTSMGVVTTAWLSPSHIVAQTPNYTVQGSCFGYLQLIDPDQLFSFQGPFDFFGAAPLQLGILHAGSLRTGGDHIMISTLTPGFQLPIDANSVLDVKFTNVADPAATSLPCDGVRVFCTFKQGVTFPANYAINDFIDVVTPAVPVSGLYSITIDASGYNSNTLRGAILYSDYKFMDVVNTPYGQARGTIYLQPAPTPQDPSNGYEAIVLPKGWNPLYPCNDSSTQVLSNISGIEGGVAPGTVVADTSSNGVSVDGVFRLDGSGVFAAAVDLPQAPLVGLPSPLNTVHAQPIVLHNAGEPAQVPTVLTSNPQCPF